MTVHEAILSAVGPANPGRRVEVVDCPDVPLCPDVPSVVFETPEDFAEAFEGVKGASYGNAELVQVYLKRSPVAVVSEDGESSSVVLCFVAEFAVKR